MNKDEYEATHLVHFEEPRFTEYWVQKEKFTIIDLIIGKTRKFGLCLTEEDKKDYEKRYKELDKKSTRELIYDYYSLLVEEILDWED